MLRNSIYRKSIDSFLKSIEGGQKGYSEAHFKGAFELKMVGFNKVN